MVGSPETYIQCGLWGFVGVSPTLADRLERGQGKVLSDRHQGRPSTRAFLGGDRI